MIEKQRIQIDNMIQALLHARKKIFGAPSERTHTIKLILEDSIETLSRVMCYAYSSFRKIMEVEFSDGFVKTYNMEDIIKIETE